MRILLGLLFSVLSFSAFSAVPTDNALNEIVDAYRSASSAWEPTIRNYAYRLFWLLVAIDFSWGAIKLALEKSEFESFWAFVVNRVMTIGFFLALISFGSSWSKTIIDSMRELAGYAGGASVVNPSQVLDQGLNVAVTMINQASGVLQPVDTMIAGLLGIIILIIYALIAAELIFVLVSMWVILYAGIIMLAFGGSEWTRSYAINYYKTILAVAVKLFVLQLLVALGQTIIQGWASTMSVDPAFEEMFVIAGGVLVLYVLVKGIGGLVESLINGHGAASASGSSAIVAAAAAGAAAVGGMAAAGAGAAQNTAGSYQAVSAATTLANMNSEANGPSGIAQSMASLGESMGGERGASMGRSLGGAFDKVAGTVKEAASAYAQDYGARAGGDFSAQHGTAPGRMASIMNDKIAEASLGGGDDSAPSEGSNYISGVSSFAQADASVSDAVNGTGNSFSSVTPETDFGGSTVNTPPKNNDEN